MDRPTYIILCSRCGVDSPPESIGNTCSEFRKDAADKDIVSGWERRCGGVIVIKKVEDNPRV